MKISCLETQFSYIVNRMCRKTQENNALSRVCNAIRMATKKLSNVLFNKDERHNGVVDTWL